MGLLSAFGDKKVKSTNTQTTQTYAFSNQGAGPAYNVAGNTAPVQITSTDFNAISRAFDFSTDALAQNSQVLRASLAAGQDLAAQALKPLLASTFGAGEVFLKAIL